jgi:hypothetical protein
MRKTTHSFAAALLALAALTSGCTESATVNDPGAPALSIYGSRVTVSPATATVAVGVTTPLTAIVKDRKGRILAGASVSWSSASPVIATVSSTGVVTGVAAGSVAITARYAFYSATAQITVTGTIVPPPVDPITSLVVLPNPATLASGATQQFTVTGRRTAAPTTPVPVTVAFTATGGTVSSTGVFTAGTTAGTAFAVTATLTGSGTPTVTGVSSVTVTTIVTPPPPPPPPPTAGTWVNVTPANVNLSSNLSCGNFGTETVQVDPNRPSDLYAQFHCQGVWKSVDYGKTWVGPINTGTNGATVSDCAGGIRLATNGTSTPTLYLSCIRGVAIGFWRSLDAGVNWTHYVIAPAASGRQDVYPPMVDPYDPQHLIMAGHEQDLLVESVNGGQSWTSIPINAGMREGSGTGSISFINTGSAAATRGTFLWMAQQSGGVYGTWRTTNAGGSWVQVDKNEHPHGYAEAYQPDANGVIYIAGVYSDLGWGVLRSTNYGVTWSHVGSNGNQRVVYSTPKAVYSSYSYPTGLGATDGPSFQMAAQPGNGAWTSPATPAAMREGAAQAAVTFDGTRYTVVTANYGAGLWLYIEP